MKILLYTLIVAMGFWGYSILLPGLRLRRIGPSLVGSVFIAGAIVAVIFESWLSLLIALVVAFVIGWIIRLIFSDVKETTMLHQAVIENNLGKVRSLLVTGADANAKNEKGETPLDLAVSLRYEDIAKMLNSHVEQSFQDIQE